MLKMKDVTKVTDDYKDSIQLSWAIQESIRIDKRALNNTAGGQPAPSSGRLERRRWLALDCAAHLLLLRGALRLRVNIKKEIVMFENWFIIGARLCKNCKIDIDVKNEGIDCEDNGKEHTWHNDSWEDMCCVCGRDYEMVWK